MMLEQIMQLALRVEIYYKGLGDEVPIKNHSLHEIMFRKLPFLTMYIVAFVIAIFTYAQAMINSTESIDRGGLWDLNDLPMTITTAIYLLEVLYECLQETVHLLGNDGLIPQLSIEVTARLIGSL